MSRLTRLLLVISLTCLAGGAAAAVAGSEPQDLALIATWSGDYPVAALEQLPAGQRQNRVGYLGDAAALARVWQSFMPGETPPAVDFAKSLVVFSRNVDFYNRTHIFKVTLAAGVAEVLAMETMSAIPLAEKAAMAMAVVPRAGIRAIRIDSSVTIPVD